LIYKTLKVKPNSHQNKLTILDDGTWLVSLTALPIKGEANKELLAFLASSLKIPKSKINILKGSQSRYKRVEIDVNEEIYI
jgi:uncharacterized protein YggU (UPF0235/DUF167 family)